MPAVVIGPSTLCDDPAPSARRVPPGALAAPTYPRAQPERLETPPWPEERASGRRKDDGVSLSTTRHADVVRLLLAHGARVDAKDEAGDTPLHMAAYEGHVEAVRALLDGGSSAGRQHARCHPRPPRPRPRPRPTTTTATLTLTPPHVRGPAPPR